MGGRITQPSVSRTRRAHYLNPNEIRLPSLGRPFTLCCCAFASSPFSTTHNTGTPALCPVLSCPFLISVARLSLSSERQGDRERKKIFSFRVPSASCCLFIFFDLSFDLTSIVVVCFSFQPASLAVHKEVYRVHLSIYRCVMGVLDEC